MLRVVEFESDRSAAAAAEVSLFGALVAACVGCATVAEAQLNITITEGQDAAAPIAVVPFGWQGSGPAAFDFAGVVSSDLGSSGRFAPMATSDMVSRPTQAAQVNFAQWRTLETDYLVIGTLTQDATPDNFTATFQLFDVVRGESLTGFRLQAARADLRKAAHRISDMIFEELTGIPGVFSTQIAYISEERRPDGTKLFRLIVSDADGENAQRVAESAQPLMSPSWSPDARRLAYVSFEGGVSGVYVQTLRTGTRERVSARAGVNSSPTFSPDGRMLALVLSRETGNLDIHTLDLSTQVLRQLTTDAAIDTEPSWSPDGRSIYFTSDRARRPAGLPRRHRARRTRAARDVRRHLQRAAAALAGRQADRRRVRREQSLSHRRRESRQRRAADPHERPSRRVAELRAERRADHLRDARGRTRRARVREHRRPHPDADRVRGRATFKSPCGDRSRGRNPELCSILSPTNSLRPRGLPR